jgi:hypothetical protein
MSIEQSVTKQFPFKNAFNTVYGGGNDKFSRSIVGNGQVPGKRETSTEKNEAWQEFLPCKMVFTEFQQTAGSQRSTSSLYCGMTLMFGVNTLKSGECLELTL